MPRQVARAEQIHQCVCEEHGADHDGHGANRGPRRPCKSGQECERWHGRQHADDRRAAEPELPTDRRADRAPSREIVQPCPHAIGRQPVEHLVRKRQRPAESPIATIARSAPAQNATIGRAPKISDGGGYNPLWRGDGRALYYLNPHRQLVEADVSLTPTFHTGASRTLFPVPVDEGLAEVYVTQYAVARDGQRVLVKTPAAPLKPMVVRVNWGPIAPQ